MWASSLPGAIPTKAFPSESAALIRDMAGGTRIGSVLTSKHRFAPQGINRVLPHPYRGVAYAKESRTRQKPPALPPLPTRTTRSTHMDLVFEAMAVTEGMKNAEPKAPCADATETPSQRFDS